MSRRQHIRATPGAAAASPLVIGVQLVPTGVAPRRQGYQAEDDGGGGGGGARAIYIEPTITYGGGTCNWFVTLLGASTSEIVWAITTDEGYEESVLFDESFEATGPIQLVYSVSGSATNIVIYATQDGETVQSEPIECLA